MSARFWYCEELLDPSHEEALTSEELDWVIQSVRDSSFLDDHSGKSIDERMTEVFNQTRPEWMSFQASDETVYVNCYGAMYEDDRIIKIVLQFELSYDLESFMLSSMLIDGYEQPEEVVIEFENQFACWSAEE
ncbi:MAG: hypothetical protein IJP17_07255 [Clostridia bacterium]|nr:hypothetical protein [Clostridia bacterium]